MLKAIRGSYIAASVLYMVIGIILLLFPEMSLKIVCAIFGTVILAIGLIKILTYFKNRDVGFIGQLGLVIGIIISVMGGFLLLQPDVILSILPVIIGIYIIFDSLQNFKQALELYKAGYDKWWSMLLLAAVLVILGVVIVINPFKTVALSVRFIGAIFVFNGIANIASIIFTSKQVKKINAVIDVEPDELRDVE